MRIRAFADRLGTTPQAVRFYEAQGFLPAPRRAENGYREYGDADAERLRLLLGLRALDLPLDQAAELASMCGAGRCDEVSRELRQVLAEKRVELARRIDELRYLDKRLAHLQGDLSAGESPRQFITLRKGGPE